MTSTSTSKSSFWAKLGYGFKAFSVLLGWAIGSLCVLIGALNSDLEGNSIPVVFGILIFYMASSINRSMRRERMANEPPEAEY